MVFVAFIVVSVVAVPVVVVAAAVEVAFVAAISVVDFAVEVDVGRQVLELRRIYCTDVSCHNPPTPTFFLGLRKKETVHVRRDG